MKLVENGEIGLFVDSNYLNTLISPELIEGEINRISMGNFEPVTRNNNNVVIAQDYIEFLKARKLDIEKQAFMAKKEILEKKRKRDAEIAKKKKEQALALAKEKEAEKAQKEKLEAEKAQKEKLEAEKAAEKQKQELVTSEKSSADISQMEDVELRLLINKQEDIIQQLLTSAKKYKELYQELSAEDNRIMIDPKLASTIYEHTSNKEDANKLANIALAVGLTSGKQLNIDVPDEVLDLLKVSGDTHD